jgi:D-galactarolactone cycloisomerase
MKIAGIDVRRYTFPLEPPFRAAWDPVPRDRLETALVFVHTDEGLTGVGSGDTMDGFARYEHLFVGEDPLAIDRHVRVLETIAFHAGRYWPLEAALWDLAGKAEGRTVAELLGGSVRRLPVYASSGELMPPEERSDAAVALAEAGFRALKLRVERARVEEGAAGVVAVREAVGEAMEIMVDLNQGWRMPGDVSAALDGDAVRALADRLRELNVLWLEEPLAGADVHGLAELRATAGIRLAGGEMARTLAELLGYLEAEALDVYQPDAVLAVGIERAREVAARVRAVGLWFTPHTWTNGIGLLANLHVAAAVDAGPFLEFPYDPPGWTPERRDWMLAEPILPDADGCLSLPERPGLGIVLDTERLQAHRVA